MAQKAVENLESLFKTVQIGIVQRDPTIIGIVVAVLVVILTILVVSCFAGRDNKRAVLLVGLCEAGKTLLFARLIHKKYVTSYTSTTSNSGTYDFVSERKGSLRIIDLPGYERIRNTFLDQYKHAARGMIFVVDSLSFQREIKDVAEFLYSLLTDQVISHSYPPILIACNKHDQTLAKGARVIQTQLEKELNTLRVTQGAQLQGTDNVNSSKVFLGKQGKPFTFADLKSFKIEFVECSAKGKGDNGEPGEADLNEVLDWLHKIA